MICSFNCPHCLCILYIKVGHIIFTLEAYQDATVEWESIHFVGRIPLLYYKFSFGVFTCRCWRNGWNMFFFCSSYFPFWSSSISHIISHSFGTSLQQHFIGLWFVHVQNLTVCYISQIIAQNEKSSYTSDILCWLTNSSDTSGYNTSNASLNSYKFFFCFSH